MHIITVKKYGFTYVSVLCYCQVELTTYLIAPLINPQANGFSGERPAVKYPPLSALLADWLQDGRSYFLHQGG